LLAVALLMGSSAWGTIYPTKDINFRIKSATEWNTVKEASETNSTFELNYYKGLFIMQQYEIPNLSRASQITLTIFGSVDNTFPIVDLWIYSGSSDWTASTSASTIYDKIYETIGIKPNCESLGTEGDAVKTPLVQSPDPAGTYGSVDDKTIRTRTLTISGTALESLKSAADGNKISIILTDKNYTSNTSNHKPYSVGCTTEALRPQMEVTYYPVTVTRDDIETGYASFDAAFSAATTANDIITLYEDAEISGSRKENTVALTIQGSTGTESIKRASGNTSNLLILPKANLTIQNLILDDNNVAATNSMIESSQSGITTTLSNVTVKNSVTTGTGGTIKTTSGTTVITNVTFVDCTSTYGCIYANRYNVTLTGDNTFTDCGVNVYLAGTGSGSCGRITGQEATHTTPITIQIDDSRSYDVIVAKGTSTSQYRLVNKGWLLTRESGSNKDVKASKVTTSYDLTIGEAGMATLVLPFNVSTLPTGASSGTIKAYKLTTTSSVVSASEVTSITKDQPVLIVGTADTYTFTGDATADYSTDAPTNGALIGTYKTIDAADDNYVLQYQNGVAGFYKLVESSNHVINPFRAYLSGDENTAGARMLSISFNDNTTGIEDAVKSEEFLAEPSGKAERKVKSYYDLSGRRVENPTKGLYIVNGKKVIIK